MGGTVLGGLGEHNGWRYVLLLNLLFGLLTLTAAGAIPPGRAG
jgi:hypothetical protein